MICPKCQYDNPEDVGKCGNCAAGLIPEGETAAFETQTLRPPETDFTPGTVIAGKYKLLEELGRGGMGSVFRAEQISPIKREVALKIIKMGMDTARVVARFDAERQALAVMDHPNIAKVLDAGATETGRPFFVMELVHGIPIDVYCDKHRLSINERLGLFKAVCQAVQHAHQKGVIHRDLKPSNILVVVQDGEAVPKVIDFGIAKATGARLTERTLFTEQGQLIGTPEYMSPEQAEMSGLDIDTRTDIYSLGVMLYGLLVGKLPFEPETLRAAGLAEIQRIIRDTDPPRPSTRLSTLGIEGSAVAKKMRLDMPALRRELRGDLDWIIMKALEKDRTRRYATASEFSSDIDRHLRHEPVSAGPPSKAYRIRKYIRRHKLGVAAASLVILAILAGIAGTSLGLIKAIRAEKKAREEAQTARQVSSFLVDLFEVSDPGEARGNTITAREILDRGAEKIKEELTAQPLIQSRIMETIGQVYQNLGLFDEAEDLLKKALDVREEASGENHYYVGASLVNLGWLYLSQNRQAEAEPLIRRGVDILAQYNVDDPLAYARGLTMLGMILRDRGEFDPGQDSLERALDILEEARGKDHEDVSLPLYHLGWLHKLKGEYETAADYYERAYIILERELGIDHPYTLWCLNDMAVIAEIRGDQQRAKELNLKVIDIGERIFGHDHPFLASPLNNIGIVHWRLGEYKEAEASAKRSILIREKVFGIDHPLIASTWSNLSLIYLEIGFYDLSRQSLERALAINEKTAGPDSLGMAETLHNLAVLDFYTGDFESAEAIFDRTLAVQEKILGPDHPDIAVILSDYGLMSRTRGNFPLAESHLRRALAIREKNFGAESNEVADALMNLARLYAVQKDLEKADSFYRRGLGIYEKNTGLESPNILFARASYLALTGDRTRALEYLGRALEVGYSRSFFNNPSFASLRGDEEFEALVAESKKSFPEDFR